MASQDSPILTYDSDKGFRDVSQPGSRRGRRTKIKLFLDKTEESPLQLITENHRKTKKD